nr:unnamed protein product [Spirometra erinaceieuropaei]
MNLLEQNHLLSDLQHGFRQKRSCLSSLLPSTKQWTRALDEDGRVDDIYTDFKKAFDSVPRKRLIYKLSEIGIRRRLLTWITDFLTGRSQTVCVEASRSTSTPVLSGVLQGSVLGPLLFLVYINDCVDDLGCSAIMFADDVKLWRPIRSDADRYALQDSLNRLKSWSARWLLNFNVDKCVVQRLRTEKTTKEDDSFQYVLGGQPLSNVVEQKDLGGKGVICAEARICDDRYRAVRKNLWGIRPVSFRVCSQGLATVVEERLSTTRKRPADGYEDGQES